MINWTFLPTELCVNRKSILIIEIPSESGNLLGLCMTHLKSGYFIEGKTVVKEVKKII